MIIFSMFWRAEHIVDVDVSIENVASVSGDIKAKGWTNIVLFFSKKMVIEKIYISLNITLYKKRSLAVYMNDTTIGLVSENTTFEKEILVNTSGKYNFSIEIFGVDFNRTVVLGIVESDFNTWLAELTIVGNIGMNAFLLFFSIPIVAIVLMVGIMQTAKRFKTKRRKPRYPYPFKRKPQYI